MKGLYSSPGSLRTSVRVNGITVVRNTRNTIHPNAATNIDQQTAERRRRLDRMPLALQGTHIGRSTHLARRDVV
jgi:hypothetical protein